MVWNSLMEEEDTAECTILIGETVDDWVRSVRGIMLVIELSIGICTQHSTCYSKAMLRGPFLTGPSTHNAHQFPGMVLCASQISLFLLSLRCNLVH